MRTTSYRKPEAERAERVVVLMPKAILEAVDAWGVPAGHASRTAAIRTLIQRGLEAVARLETGGQPVVGQGQQT